MSRNRGRLAANAIARGVMYALSVIALVPLALVLLFTVTKGLPAVRQLEFFTNSFRPEGIPGAGEVEALHQSLKSSVLINSLLPN